MGRERLECVQSRLVFTSLFWVVDGLLFGLLESTAAHAGGEVEGGFPVGDAWKCTLRRRMHEGHTIRFGEMAQRNLERSFGQAVLRCVKALIVDESSNIAEQRLRRIVAETLFDVRGGDLDEATVAAIVKRLDDAHAGQANVDVDGGKEITFSEVRFGCRASEGMLVR